MCGFCPSPRGNGHSTEECWERRRAEHYAKHGAKSFFDARANFTADGLDVDYDEMLCGNSNAGKDMTSEYSGGARAYYKRTIREMRDTSIITRKLAKKLLALSAGELKAGTMILDSGSTMNLTGCMRLFTEYKTLKNPIRIKGFAHGMSASAVGVGTVTIVSKGKRVLTRQPLRPGPVFHVPKMPFGLLSLAVMLDQGYEFHVHRGHIDIVKDNQFVMTAHRRGNLFLIEPKETGVKEKSVTFESVASSTHAKEQNRTEAEPDPNPSLVDLTHHRFGHVNVPDLIEMAGHKLVKGMPPLPKVKGGSLVSPCEPCLQGKMHRFPFPKQVTTRASHPLELIHLDLVGPFRQTTTGGARYFLTMVDDYSRRASVGLLKDKSAESVFKAFKEWLDRMETSTGRKLGGVRTDRGKEFFNKTLKALLTERGAKHQAGPPHTPQHNGVAERMNRTLLNMTRCMLHGSGVHLSWWGDALLHAVYVHNRTVTSSLRPAKTPLEAWTGEPPDVSRIRTFGCKAWALIQEDDRDHQPNPKLAPRVLPCVHLGVERDSKSWRLYCLPKKAFIVSRDVVFDEAAIVRGNLGHFTVPHPDVASHTELDFGSVIQEFFEPPSVLPSAYTDADGVAPGGEHSPNHQSGMEPRTKPAATMPFGGADMTGDGRIPLAKEKEESKVQEQGAGPGQEVADQLPTPTQGEQADGREARPEAEGREARPEPPLEEGTSSESGPSNSRTGSHVKEGPAIGSTEWLKGSGSRSQDPEMGKGAGESQVRKLGQERTEEVRKTRRTGALIPRRAPTTTTSETSDTSSRTGRKAGGVL